MAALPRPSLKVLRNEKSAARNDAIGLARLVRCRGRSDGSTRHLIAVGAPIQASPSPPSRENPNDPRLHSSCRVCLNASDILDHRGQFRCPRTAVPSAKAAVSVLPPAGIPDAKLQVVIADLRKRGTARPRKLATLRNTIAAAFQKQISEAEVTALLTALRVNGHVVVNDQSVSYNLPAKGA